MSLVDDFEEEEELHDDDIGALNYVHEMHQTELYEEKLAAAPPEASAEDSEPMFTIDRVKGFSPRGLRQMVVQSNVIAMSLDNGHIIRFPLDNPTALQEIEFSKRVEYSIHKIFLDPTGNHLVVSMDNAENWYIHSSWAKPRQLTKMKGVIIESIAWDKTNTDASTTKEILLGARNGIIFETVIEAKEKLFVEGKERYFKPIFNLNADADRTVEMPITGLYFERFPPTPTAPTKYFILASTPMRIYQFIGGPTFEAVFNAYEGNLSFVELPGEMGNSELKLFAKHPNGLPKSFAWMTGPGVYSGNLVFGNQSQGDSVMTDMFLQPYLASPSSMGGAAAQSSVRPLSLVLTEFHFLLLFPDRFQAVSRLTKQVVHEDPFPVNAGVGRLRGMTNDLATNTFWIYTDMAVFELTITREDRNVWMNFLEKGQYEQALQYARDPLQKDKVWTLQAEQYFAQGNYELAATYYGKSSKSFEEVALKFITLDERDALKTYLLAKLETLRHPRDATQMTLLCTWLTELYLNKLNRLRDARLDDQADSIQEEFRAFLVDHREHVDTNTTFNLISSHGRVEELLFFATLIEDYERVINHHIQHRDYHRALSVIAKQPNAELFYKFSPVLMAHVPYETVNAWLAADPQLLNPRKLIPALMCYDPSRNPPGEAQNQAIRYLSHCVKKLGNTDPAIHNFLLSLYAAQPNEEPLLAFLSAKDRYFDLEYALRLCAKEGKAASCVVIYAAMGLYEEAVETALRISIDLAKEHADKPEDDEAMRKRLWLKIARYLVEEKRDIKAAMGLLSQCDLLKIEDILPFFPDFALIDDFKKEICESLEDYNRHIEQLKTEMDEATRSADLIRADIKELRNKYGFVAGHQQCNLCRTPALTRQFYMFPCQHVFHADCLIGEMVKYLDNATCKRIYELQQKIEQAKATQTAPAAASVSRTAGRSAEEHNMTMPQSEQYKNELDELVAAECLLCGRHMIESITKPFIGADEREAIRSWFV